MGIKDIASRVKAASSDAQAALNAKIAQAANSRAGDAAKIAISTGKTLLSAIETARPDFSAEIPSASLDAVDAYIDALRGDINAAKQTLDQMQREAMMPGEVPDAAALIQNTNDLLTTIAETPVQVNVDGPIVFTDTSIDRGVTVETNRELPYMNINIDKAIENAQKAEADANQAETSNDQVEQTANADPVDIAPELYADENALPQDFAGVEQQTVTEDAWSTRMNASEQACSSAFARALPN